MIEPTGNFPFLVILLESQKVSRIFHGIGKADLLGEPLKVMEAVLVNNQKVECVRNGDDL